jgi:hypothetical protein
VDKSLPRCRADPRGRDLAAKWPVYAPVSSMESLDRGMLAREVRKLQKKERGGIDPAPYTF